MTKPSIVYRTESSKAIECLETIVDNFRDEAMRERKPYTYYDKQDAAIAQTYINAQLALLKLMKEEESEGNRYE
mgnify:FL=1|nr:MAG TPA: hypothetical protein [Caudoviricetes sp.]